MQREDVLRVAGEPVAWLWETAAETGIQRARPHPNLGVAVVPLYTETKLLAMYAAGADGCSTQAAVAMYLAGAEESRAALAAADERIREMEDEIKERSALSARRESAFTKAVHAQIAERAISDKLEKALKVAKAFCDGLTAEECPDTIALPISAALAEVAHIRSQEVAAT